MPSWSSPCIHQCMCNSAYVYVIVHPLFPKIRFQVWGTSVLFLCLVLVGFTGPEWPGPPLKVAPDAPAAPATQSASPKPTPGPRLVPTGKVRCSCNQTPKLLYFNLLYDGFISISNNLLCTDTEKKWGAAKKSPHGTRGDGKLSALVHGTFPVCKAWVKDSTGTWDDILTCGKLQEIEEAKNLTRVNKNGLKTCKKTVEINSCSPTLNSLSHSYPTQHGYDVGGKSKAGGGKKCEKAPFPDGGSRAAWCCWAGNSFQPQ